MNVFIDQNSKSIYNNAFFLCHNQHYGYFSLKWCNCSCGKIFKYWKREREKSSLGVSHREKPQYLVLSVIAPKNIVICIALWNIYDSFVKWCLCSLYSNIFVHFVKSWCHDFLPAKWLYIDMKQRHSHLAYSGFFFFFFNFNYAWQLPFMIYCLGEKSPHNLLH